MKFILIVMIGLWQVSRPDTDLITVTEFRTLANCQAAAQFIIANAHSGAIDSNNYYTPHVVAQCMAK